MPRPEKVEAVADIKERIESAQAVFVTEFRGLSVTQMQSLRAALRAADAEYKVVKMTLAKRATDELGIEGIDEYLVGPTALAFAKSDSVAAAKALKEVGEANEALVVKAGILSGEVILAEQIEKLAKIEPREVLLAKIAGAAKAPLYKTAQMLGSFTQGAATMMTQLLEKKEAGEFLPLGESPAPAADTATAAEEE